MTVRIIQRDAVDRFALRCTMCQSDVEYPSEDEATVAFEDHQYHVHGNKKYKRLRHMEQARLAVKVLTECHMQGNLTCVSCTDLIQPSVQMVIERNDFGGILTGMYHHRTCRPDLEIEDAA